MTVHFHGEGFAHDGLPMPHAAGCDGCRRARACSVCGGDATAGARCTNGHCLRCHAVVCTGGGTVSDGHGAGSRAARADRLTVVRIDRGRAVAARFVALLREGVDDARWAAMRAANAAEEHPNVCHSHDLCDANEVMAAAIESSLGWTMPDGDAFEGSEFQAVWGEAWERARWDELGGRPAVKCRDCGREPVEVCERGRCRTSCCSTSVCGATGGGR